jgi:hypothetical protein
MKTALFILRRSRSAVFGVAVCPAGGGSVFVALPTPS